MKVVQLADTGGALALHLAYVKRGGTVRIVDQTGPVADLVPVLVQHDAGSGDDALLAMLEQQGLVRRGADDAMPDDLFGPGPEGSRARVLDALLEERRGSR